MLIAVGLLVGITVSRRRKCLCFGRDLEASIRGNIGALPIFSYEVLKQKTNDFDENNQLGDGEFGSIYLGKLRDGFVVAVTRLYEDNRGRVQ